MPKKKSMSKKLAKTELNKKNLNNLNIVKSWKFRPTKEDNEVMKEPLSKEDKELLEREIEVNE